MTHGWTPERRKKQSEMIRRWKPWEKSTGPKTEAGKRASSQNSTKHGMRSAMFRVAEKMLAELARVEREVRKLL